MLTDADANRTDLSLSTSVSRLCDPGIHHPGDHYSLHHPLLPQKSLQGERMRFREKELFHTHLPQNIKGNLVGWCSYTEFLTEPFVQTHSFDLQRPVSTSHLSEPIGTFEPVHLDVLGVSGYSNISDQPAPHDQATADDLSPRPVVNGTMPQSEENGENGTVQHHMHFIQCTIVKTNRVVKWFMVYPSRTKLVMLLNDVIFIKTLRL